jgi:hypothetical protein
MILQCLKSANLLSHTEFLSFANKLCFEISENSGNENPKVLEHIRRDLVDFASCIKDVSQHSIWSELDILEGKRYSLWEKIVDKLDDNLNLEITDYYFVLEKINLTLKTAYGEVPSYAASWDLLLPGETPERRIFPSRRHALGHYWMPKDMNTFIERLIDIKYKDLCEIAGIAADVAELSEIQQQFTVLSLISDIEVTLSSLRKCRYYICVGFCVAIKSDTDGLKRLKKHVQIDAGVLFEDRFFQRGERMRMEKWSVDTLPFSLFFSLVEKSAQRLFEKEPDSGLYEDYQTDLPVLLKCYNAFRSHLLWEQFEKEEHAFYKEILLLLDKVTHFTCCYNADNEAIWERFTKSDTYNAASMLLYEYATNAVTNTGGTLEGEESDSTISVSWEPGSPINHNAIEVIITYWGTTENRLHLTTLHALDLFERCIALNKAASDTASLIQNLHPDADLSTLRKYRYFMGLFLDVVED